jgi:hypothetical protein
MTQSQLISQIARITGEPLSAVNRVGFNLVHERPVGLEPENVKLVLDCPFCGHRVPYPGLAGDGSKVMAQCDRCDVYFDFDNHEVYPVRADTMSGQAD